MSDRKMFDFDEEELAGYFKSHQKQEKPTKEEIPLLKHHLAKNFAVDGDGMPITTNIEEALAFINGEDAETELDRLIEEERQIDNSNDIYKLSARIKNEARMSGGNLTEQGLMMCNLYTHVLKSFYNFAEKLEDGKTKKDLLELIKSHENFPGHLIVSLNPKPPKN